MWDVLDYFVMELTRIFYSCEFVKVEPPDVSTVIYLAGGLLFSLGAVVRRYMDVDPLYVTPYRLSLFSIFVVGVADFE